jgi:prolyl 4-hydroxylase
MGKIKHLSAEWEEWVLTNIARGVPPGMLVEDMVNKDFDRAFATSSVMQRAGLRVANDAANEAVTVAPSRIAPANHIDIEGHRIRVTSRIDAPDVVVLENVLSERECDELIALSRSKLARSTTIDRDTGAEQVIAARSSEGAFFMRGENPLVSCIEQRLAALTGMPIENGEGLQILHYGTGGEYQPHFDFFEPEHAGSAAHLKTGGQRVSTIILYLNDVEAGGETIFPDITFAVTARKGAAVYFSYCDSNGELDRLTLHGGAPVRRGEKWIATKWLRQGPHR